MIVLVRRSADQSHAVLESHQRANLDYKVRVSTIHTAGTGTHSTIRTVAMFPISVQHSITISRGAIDTRQSILASVVFPVVF